MCRNIHAHNAMKITDILDVNLFGKRIKLLQWFGLQLKYLSNQHDKNSGLRAR